MKKLLKAAAVVLAAGLIMIAAGAFWAHKDNVSMAGIYSLIEENLKLEDDEAELAPPEKHDMSAVSDTSDSRIISCELNEFNTIELYTESSTVKFERAEDEKVSAWFDKGSLTSGISEGRLYIQAVTSDEGAELEVHIPETYKGGFVLNASGCEITMGSVESAMDMSFNMHDCRFNCGALSSDNITLLLSGSTVNAEGLGASDSLSIESVSSRISADSVSANSAAVKARNSSITLKNAGCAVNADVNRCDLELAAKYLSGNITLNVTAGKARVSLPKEENAVIMCEKTYAIFTNKTNYAQNDLSNKAAAYTIDTNIKFGIVTVENK